MFSFHYILKKVALCLSTVCMALGASSQQLTEAGAVAKTGSNQLEILLIITMVVLAFTIWGLGQVLIALSSELLKKTRQAQKLLGIVSIFIFLFPCQWSVAQTSNITTAATVPANYGGLSANIFYLFVSVLCIEILTILFLTFSIRRIYVELVPNTKKEFVNFIWLTIWWKKMDNKIFTRAIPIEREADFLLDHDYDGIRELDNALPPWWKYGFYFTIGVAIIYLLNFHVFGNGKNPTQEYAAEMEQANIDKQIYEAGNKDKIDEDHIYAAGPGGMATAKEIFTTKCWACHGKSGEGGAGPNLTDDYWLHKGSLNDIYHTIKTGYPDKGMQSWASEFSPKEISYLASYVKSLRGTHPVNPKAPQGDLYLESNPLPGAIDSAGHHGEDSAADKKVQPTRIAAGNLKRMKNN